MNFEIITIGDELLIGQTIDTNSVFIAQALAPIGLNVSRKTAIKDDRNHIVSALNESLSRVSIVIITGGLGPTNDDITQSVLQDFFQCGTRIDETVLAHLRHIFRNRDSEIFELNKKQAELPEKSITLFNSEGTAPGILFEENSKMVIAMPGVPGEVRAIVNESLIPILKSKLKLPVLLHRTLVTISIPESVIAHKLQKFEETLDGISLAYLPSQNMVKLRLTQTNPLLNPEVFNFKWQNLVSELGEWVFDIHEEEPSKWLLELLKRNQWTISTAESCTGGYFGNQLVLQSGASSVYKGSVIAYDNEIKIKQLDVSADLIEKHGAVSEEVAHAMVLGVCKHFNSDVAIASTGIAGPNGGTTEKPVGTIFIGIKVLDQITVKKYTLRGNRLDFMIRAFNTAMKQLKDMC